MAMFGDIFGNQVIIVIHNENHLKSVTGLNFGDFFNVQLCVPVLRMDGSLEMNSQERSLGSALHGQAGLQDAPLTDTHQGVGYNNSMDLDGLPRGSALQGD